MRTVGTVVRGIRTPIIKEGDNLPKVVVDSLLRASEAEHFNFNDRDVVAVTEAVVGISYGNYATIDEVAKDIKNKFNTDRIGVVYPILSRNRFALILKAIARAMNKITILLSYPSDEQGNGILYEEDLEKYNIDKFNHVISETEYKEKFGHFVHMFTGVNMVDFYTEVCAKENCEVEFVLSNKPEVILDYEENILVCDVHTRFDTVKRIKAHGGNKILTLCDILNESVDGSGFNSEFGLLGSNRSTEERLKLFPQNEEFVYEVQRLLKEKTGKNIEVMIYGDGAFKDPVMGIWELADPVVSPNYTKGLEGSPNEIKLKYLSDNKFKDLSGNLLVEAMKKEIAEKNSNLKGNMSSQGTTPRRYVDLIGSLCDLTSGSGDKGTPVVLIQGYFDNYADE